MVSLGFEEAFVVIMFRTYLTRLSPQSKVSLDFQAFLVKVMLHGTNCNDDFSATWVRGRFSSQFLRCEFLYSLKTRNTKKHEFCSSCFTHLKIVVANRQEHHSEPYSQARITGYCYQLNLIITTPRTSCRPIVSACSCPTELISERNSIVLLLPSILFTQL